MGSEKTLRERDAEGRLALGIARGLRLLRATKLMLTSVTAVQGQSRVFDGDVGMVRTAVAAMERWAHEEGVRV